MKTGTVRRITKLHVDEISLVDRPANREPFLLYKSEDGGSEEVQAVMTDAEAREEAELQKEEIAELAKKEGDPAKEKYLNDDGTFKDGFDGCMAYQKDEQGLEDENARKVCSLIRKTVAPKTEEPVKKEEKAVATPDLLARLADGGKTPEATAKGLVKYDSGAVAGAIDRILALGKDSQAAINPASGDAWTSGTTKPEGSNYRQNIEQSIVTASQGFNPGAPDAGSQGAVSPAGKWDASMIGPVGDTTKKVEGSVTHGPTGSPLTQGGSPAGASQGSIGKK